MQENPSAKGKYLLPLKVLLVSSLLSGCSNTGNIDYRPVKGALRDGQQGHNFTLALLDLPDERPAITRLRSGISSDLVGVFPGYFVGLKIPLRKLYSAQAISFDVTDAIGHLLEANGYKVRKHSDLSSLSAERVAVKGRINEFLIEGGSAWRGSPPSIMATIDIDLRIIDTKCRRMVWDGKIENYRRMGPNRGLFTGTKRIFLFFNEVLSDAIKRAWIDEGMQEALGGLREVCEG